MSDALINPDEGERMLWGRVQEPPREWSPLLLKAGSIGVALLWIVTLAVEIRNGLSDMRSLTLWLTAFLLMGWIGDIVRKLFIGVEQTVTTRLRPDSVARGTAYWLSDRRLIVEPEDASETNVAIDLSRFTRLRHDFDRGSPVLIATTSTGDVTLRSADLSGLEAALRRIRPDI